MLFDIISIDRVNDNSILKEETNKEIDYNERYVKVELLNIEYTYGIREQINNKAAFSLQIRNKG